MAFEGDFGRDPVASLVRWPLSARGTAALARRPPREPSDSSPGLERRPVVRSAGRLPLLHGRYRRAGWRCAGRVTPGR